MTEHEILPPGVSPDLSRDGTGFPPPRLWAWLLLPVPSIACGLLTITLQSVFTHASVFHLLLVATPFSFAAGIALGTILAIYLVRSRWCYLIALLQLACVGLTYLAVSDPGVEIFP